MNTTHCKMKTPEIGKPGGQEFSIVRSIKTFLEQMAEGSARPAPTVLKELLQNADDAGATEIEITLDIRSLPKQETPYDLLLEPLKQCQIISFFPLSLHMGGMGLFF